MKHFTLKQTMFSFALAFVAVGSSLAMNNDTDIEKIKGILSNPVASKNSYDGTIKPFYTAPLWTVNSQHEVEAEVRELTRKIDLTGTVITPTREGRTKLEDKTETYLAEEIAKPLEPLEKKAFLSTKQYLTQTQALAEAMKKTWGPTKIEKNGNGYCVSVFGGAAAVIVAGGVFVFKMLK